MPTAIKDTNRQDQDHRGALIPKVIVHLPAGVHHRHLTGAPAEAAVHLPEAVVAQVAVRGVPAAVLRQAQDHPKGDN